MSIQKGKLFTYLPHFYNHAIALLYTPQWYYPQQVDVLQDRYYAKTICSMPTVDVSYDSYHATLRYVGLKKCSYQGIEEMH